MNLVNLLKEKAKEISITIPSHIPYIQDPSLNEQEQKMRALCFNVFNPILKMVLYTSNSELFACFGYNSCRQTAFTGAYVLNHIYEDYTFEAYEGLFKEPGEQDYIHAYIIGKHKTSNRMLLIDLSRVSRPIVFIRTKESDPYPKIMHPHFQGMELIDTTRIELSEVITPNVQEFFTKLTTLEFSNIVMRMMVTPLENPNSFLKVSEQTYGLRKVR